MSSLAHAIRIHTGPMLKLTGPILISQYAYLAAGMADTVMAGDIGTLYQAAVAVGAAVWVPVQVFITGMLYAVMIGISKHHGAKCPDAVKLSAQQGIWIAIILGLLGSGLLYIFASNLTMLGVKADIADKAAQYLQALAWGIPFASLALAIRFYCDGQKNVIPATIISVITVGINIFLNYALMFGNFGFPAMDVMGCGLATAISMALASLFFAIYVNVSPLYKQNRIFSEFTAPHKKIITSFALTGLPIGVSFVSEFLVLSVIAFCISSTGAVPIASHQIAFNFMMMLFAIPTCLSMAVSIMVSSAHGANNETDKKNIVRAVIFLSVLIGFILTICMWLSADNVAQFYSNDMAVIALASKLLIIAALFQFVDAIQVCLNGCLRGIADTAIPFLITSGIYWLIAMPLGYVLSGMPLPWGLGASLHKYGAEGWWFALVVGITIVAFALAHRVSKLFFVNKKLSSHNKESDELIENRDSQVNS